MKFKKTSFALLTSLLMSCEFCSAAVASEFTDSQKKELETIVADYVSNHPEIIINAMKKLEQDERAKTQKYLTEIFNEYKDTDELPALGKKGARHVIIEFFDFNCGYCKIMEPTFKKALENYDLRIVYVNIPVIREESNYLAVAGQAIYMLDKDKYFKYHEHFMSPGNKKGDLDSIKGLITKIGLNFDDVIAKMKTMDPQKRIGKSVADSAKLKIAGTPYLIIDGKEFRGAITSYDQLKSILDEE